ncbi:hypothetical protein V8C86DRAFT_3131299 [Haematococcus lacustris]
MLSLAQYAQLASSPPALDALVADGATAMAACLQAATVTATRPTLAPRRHLRSLAQLQSAATSPAIPVLYTATFPSGEQAAGQKVQGLVNQLNHRGLTALGVSSLGGMAVAGMQVVALEVFTPPPPALPLVAATAAAAPAPASASPTSHLAGGLAGGLWWPGAPSYKDLAADVCGSVIAVLALSCWESRRAGSSPAAAAGGTGWTLFPGSNPGRRARLVDLELGLVYGQQLRRAIIRSAPDWLHKLTTSKRPAKS